jgi:adenylate cyclase
MLQACEELDRASRAEWKVPTRIGIGLNSGKARVGNTGSPRKYEYGPLGDPVNVASRVQGMTKYLKSPLLVSGETREAQQGEVAARRVVKVRQAGVKQVRDLYELAAAATGQGKFFEESEAALRALEGGQFAEAALQAARLLRDHPGDGPLQLILARAAEALVNDGAGFDPVWVPPGK